MSIFLKLHLPVITAVSFWSGLILGTESFASDLKTFPRLSLPGAALKFVLWREIDTNTITEVFTYLLEQVPRPVKPCPRITPAVGTKKSIKAPPHKLEAQPWCNQNQNQKTFRLVTENNTSNLEETIFCCIQFSNKGRPWISTAIKEWKPHGTFSILNTVTTLLPISQDCDKLVSPFW